MNKAFAKLFVAGLLALAIQTLPAQQVSFLHTPPVLTPGSGPVSVALADFTGDGIPDAAVVGPTGVFVYPGNGDGTFKAPILSASGTNLAGNVVVGDFNNDGKQDLVVGGSGLYFAAGVLLLGNGDGTFQTPLQLGVTASLSLAAGDFNGDGNLDLVFSTNSGMVVLLGNGQGGFTQKSTIPVFSVGGIAVGILSSNHHLDLVVSNPSSDSISVYPGNGDGTFGAPSNITVGLNPGPVAIRDMNGDGTRDIVVADTGSNDVAVLLGHGDGTFQPPAAFPSPGGSALQSLVIGDFNDDGIPDVAIVGYLLLGTGNGRLGAAVTYPTIAGATSVVTGDLNGDHKLDLLIVGNICCNGQSFVSILLGKGNATFRGAPDMAVGTAPVSIAVADFNGDGHADLVIANQGSNSLSVALGTGQGSFAPMTSVPLGFSPTQVIARDFNKDGKMDIAVGCAALCFGSFAVLLGDGTGGFQAPIFGPPGVPPILAAGDFNKDGIPDLAISSFDGVSLQLGNGDGTFKPPVSVFSGEVTSLAVGDLNGDGKLDLAIGEYGGLAILLGNGDGTFTTDVVFSVITSPNSALVADVNGDGKADVVVAGGPDVAVFLGNGNGTFQPERVYSNILGASGGPLPGGLAAADFNLDGKTDLAVLSQNSVSILPGNGDGSFQAAQIFGVDSNPMALALGEFNADRKPDLVVANWLSNTVSVLLNTTP